MKKQTYTALFTIISTILNIFMTLAIIFVLISLSSLFLSRILGVTSGQVYVITWMLCFLLGLIAGMFAFARISNWVIDHFKLASKLDPRLLGKYLPNGKKNPSYTQEEEKKPKTNLPASALPHDDDDVWAKNIEDAPYGARLQTPPEET